MTITTPNLSLAGQEAWNVVSIVDYYIDLQASEILNAQDEARQPANYMKLSRRMKAFLAQAVEKEIAAAYAGDYKDLWAEPGKEKLVQPLLWEDPPISFPYLILAAALLERANVKTPDDYEDSDCNWYKEAYEALASGVGMSVEFCDYWFGKNSPYGCLGD
jgi:hypothetical protein